MDDQTPPTPLTPPVAVPNPHSGAPAPASLEGMRPEATANMNVRPEQDEPGGPLAGLVGTSATQAAAEVAPARTDTDLLEQMGVESEGIESGQLLGLVGATIFSVVALAVVLIYLFYVPFLQQVDETASDVSDYPELQQSRTDARAQLGLYARADSTYQVPIDQAMGLVVGQYRGGSTAPAGLPTTRQQWNTLMLNRGTGTSVQNPAGLARRTTVEQERLAATSGGEAGAARIAPAGPQSPGAPALAPRRPGLTNEEVGVDDTVAEPRPLTLGDAQSDN